MNKKSLVLFLFFLFICFNSYSIDGVFIGYKMGVLIKVDVASAYVSKRNQDMDNIRTGIGYYGVADSHGFPRVLEAKAAPYAELFFNWGYKFPKVFSLGFSILLSNFVMPSLVFDFKFTLYEKTKLKPYVFLSVYGGILDGFPIGIMAGGGIDIYFDDHFYFLIESKIGTEIFVSRYYDDGINSNPIWHWDSTYAYMGFAIYLGFGYQFKNRFTDENGKWTGKK